MQSSGSPFSLSQRHAELEREISVEMARPLPDSTRLAALKKEKLRLKDQIEHPEAFARRTPLPQPSL